MARSLVLRRLGSGSPIPLFDIWLPAAFNPYDGFFDYLKRRRRRRLLFGFLLRLVVGLIGLLVRRHVSVPNGVMTDASSYDSGAKGKRCSKQECQCQLLVPYLCAENLATTHYRSSDGVMQLKTCAFCLIHQELAKFHRL